MSAQKRRESVIDHPDKGTRIMALPQGCNCGDCVRYLECRSFFGCNDLNEVCDWSPNQFVGLRGDQ